MYDVIMKSEKIELPDSLELCDDCGLEYDKEDVEECPVCGRELCPYCLDIHTDVPSPENEHCYEKENVK